MNWIKKRKYFLLGIVLILGISFYFILPKELFKSPYSTVVYGKESELLGARIATDGQWRFPPNGNLPKGYKEAVLLFEDKNFYNHPGIDPVAIVRAIKVNIKAGSIKQGGSTITMQVVRMALENQPRTYWQKIKEMILALRLEMAYSKDDILELYAAHAPFGGNVVGLEAASWRYFSRPPDQLSIAEYALLAVLPNAPSQLRPGKNQQPLLAKRNDLLSCMYKENMIKEAEYKLAILENLPGEPYPLPDIAPHVSQYALMEFSGQGVNTTLQADIQLRTAKLLDRYHQKLQQNGVNNAAILVADVKSGEVLAYHGNTKAGNAHGQYVDVCQSPRSSGSILKPFLYSSMQQSGQLLPDQLVADIPTFLAGFQPENYSREYQGAVAASDALARSLNVPAVRELREFGVNRFKSELKSAGFTTINRSADNYGLSLILGGAEVTLWDVCGAYLSMAQSILAEYNLSQCTAMHILQSDSSRHSPKYNPAAAYLTFKALQKAKQINGQGGVHQFANNKIAWKTGTSFGFRDAWAVGINANYVVAVWVGNADGEGRPGVIGAEAAAPIMFEVFSELPKGNAWFEQPYNQMVEVETCAQSGFLAGELCSSTIKTWATTGAENARICVFHQPTLVSEDGRFRLESECLGSGNAKVVNWFVLPPSWEHYYKKSHPGYRSLPPISPNCKAKGVNSPMQMIYPTNYQKVYVAKQVTGEQGPIVFKLAHRNYQKRVFWHANGNFIGETKEVHDLPVVLSPGKYQLKVVDEDGNEINQQLEVL